MSDDERKEDLANLGLSKNKQLEVGLHQKIVRALAAVSLSGHRAYSRTLCHGLPTSCRWRPPRALTRYVKVVRSTRRVDLHTLAHSPRLQLGVLNMKDVQCSLYNQLAEAKAIVCDIGVGDHHFQVAIDLLKVCLSVCHRITHAHTHTCILAPHIVGRLCVCVYGGRGAFHSGVCLPLFLRTFRPR